MSDHRTGHLSTVPPASHGVRRLRSGTALLTTACVLLVVASLGVGSRGLSPAVVLEGLQSGWWGDRSNGVVRIVWDLRMPRTVLALAVGAALGVAGALMQSLTRNPLADPGILGVNAGAALAVAVGLVVGLAGSIAAMSAWSMGGAAVATVAVYLLGSVGGGTTPVRLALAGTALSACLVGVTTALSVTRPEVFDVFRFWAVGGFDARGWPIVVGTVPIILAGALVALLGGRSLDALALGEDNARALGVRVGAARAAGACATTLLCGAAVAAAGPIGFVGLTVPHVVRSFAGPTAGRMLPLAALAGATLVLLADVVGRVLARPGELEAGIVTALVGGPVFVALVRRRGAVAV